MLRRVTAATLFLLMLQTLSLGSGLSALDGCEPQVGAMEDDMPGMVMPNASAEQQSERSTVPENDRKCAMPWASGCPTSGPCNLVAIVTVVAASAEGGRFYRHDTHLDVITIVNLRPAPDIPPPKSCQFATE